jgi:hypothetical protein
MLEYKQKLLNFRRSIYFPYLILIVVFGVTSLLALRHNNEQMIKLREDVYAADKTNGNVEGALRQLRTYVYSHMNTNLSTANGIKPPIQLSYTYARLEEAQQQNSALYVDAKNYCEALIPASESISGRGRIGCITDYVTSHGAKPVDIPAGLYEFDFVSPSWSPDFAGWSLVALALSVAALVFEFIRAQLFRRNYFS